MQTRLLYMDDSYLREFKARVVKVDGDRVALDQTAFHPLGGGLPADKGWLERGGERFPVEDVRLDRGTGLVFHHVPGHGLSVGDEVRGILDWERRYRVMRMHTGLHVLIAILNKMAGVLVTGNKVDVERSRVDVNLEKPDRSLVEEAFRRANEVLASDIPVKIYYMPREEALKTPGIVKLAERMPPEVDPLRIVEIPGVDIQADGGPHVSRTGEVGELVFLKLENKGRRNRRIHFTVRP